jgi:hypothetical protein
MCFFLAVALGSKGSKRFGTNQTNPAFFFRFPLLSVGGCGFPQRELFGSKQPHVFGYLMKRDQSVL